MPILCWTVLGGNYGRVRRKGVGEAMIFGVRAPLGSGLSAESEDELGGGVGGEMRPLGGSGERVK